MDSLRKEEGRRIQPCRYSSDLVTSDLSFTSVQTTGVQWLADAVHPFEICCIWTGQVQSDALNRRAMLTHDLSEDPVGTVPCTVIMAEMTRVPVPLNCKHSPTGSENEHRAEVSS